MRGQHNIEVEVREATGLGLGTFDLHVICQKIYERELTPHCQFKDEHGDWRPLPSHPGFAEVFWLIGASLEQSSGRKRAAFGGWQTGAKAKS